MNRKDALKAAVAAIVAGGGAAALASIARDNSSAKEKRKLKNTGLLPNVITIPIQKEKFMEGLPTPEQFAKSKGAAPEPGDAKIAEMSAEDIAAKKKAILRSGGKKLDFFGKRASDGEQKKDEENEAPENKEKKDDSYGNDDAHHLLRGEDGRFVSPTDPVAVEQVAKEAGVLEYFWERAQKPLVYTGGAVGSIYLASLITDKINQNRRKASDKNLAKSREDYVKKIEGQDGGSEKAAQDGLVDNMTSLGIASFLVPATLTALVTHRILENRREELKKKKLKSDSYPEEPVILYNTYGEKDAEAKTVEISPKIALAMILCKQAMIGDSVMEKEAKLMYTSQEAADNIYKWMSKERNDEKLLETVKLFQSGASDKDVAHSVAGMLPRGKTFWHRYAFNDPETANLVRHDPRIAKLINSRFADPNRAKTWGAYGNQLVDDYLAKTFKRGGWLHSLVSWLARTFGFGRSMLAGQVNKAFGIGVPQQAGQQVQPQTPVKQIMAAK